MIINKVKDHYLEIYKEALGVLLVGSHARGQARPDSDIDLCIIGYGSDFQRIEEDFQGQKVELMVGPLSWYEEVLGGYEKASNYPTISRMLCEAIYWSQRNDRVDDLIQVAKVTYEEGPYPKGRDQLNQIKRRIKRTYGDLGTIDQAGPSKTWLQYKFVDTCIDALFLVRAWWFIKDRHLMTFIGQEAPDYGKLIEDFFLTWDNKFLGEIYSKLMLELEVLEKEDGYET